MAKGAASLTISLGATVGHVREVPAVPEPLEPTAARETKRDVIKSKDYNHNTVTHYSQLSKN